MKYTHWLWSVSVLASTAISGYWSLMTCIEKAKFSWSFKRELEVVKRYSHFEKSFLVKENSGMFLLNKKAVSDTSIFTSSVCLVWSFQVISVPSGTVAFPVLLRVSGFF